MLWPAIRWPGSQSAWRLFAQRRLMQLAALPRWRPGADSSACGLVGTCGGGMSSPLRTAVPTVAALAVIALTLSLGNWQLRRAQEKMALQVQRDAALLSTAESLGPSLLSTEQAEALDGRRVQATGTFLAGRDVYLDNRSHKGIAGFHLVTPLRIAGETGTEPAHVLVVRGWVPRDPQVRERLVEPPLPTGTVTVAGVAQRELGRVLELASMPAPGPEQRIWPNLTLDQYASWSGLRLQPLLIRQTEPAIGAVPGEDDLVRDWAMPGLDVDKHRGYAFQWYALAFATAVLWLWLVAWRPLRRRLLGQPPARDD